MVIRMELDADCLHSSQITQEHIKETLMQQLPEWNLHIIHNDSNSGTLVMRVRFGMECPAMVSHDSEVNGTRALVMSIHSLILCGNGKVTGCSLEQDCIYEVSEGGECTKSTVQMLSIDLESKECFQSIISEFFKGDMSVRDQQCARDAVHHGH